ncbi:hypothetical protein ACJMK2_014971 [Sinanodonta woodiana]|uniref:Mab-21-like HhH/H2TH-like domain-containing protein n=1 Tax=Sinanodonta woodiana TaxID=1069815 RepID=A0ABD3V292_SINWO
MDEQVPDYYAQISTRLSEVLDNVGYSQADRNRKVMLSIKAELFRRLTSLFSQPLMSCSPYICGSRSEGSTGPDLHSDVDILINNDSCNVVTDYDGREPGKTNFLMVRDVHTPPGYVKLQRVETLSDHTYLSFGRDLYACTDEHGWIRNSVLDQMLAGINQAIAGPAVHYGHSLKLYSSDGVHVLRCSNWPIDGSEWFSRQRHHGWPSEQQIENARKYGCFVTPFGHACSAEKHLEWRVSFALAERALTRSFEDTVMKVYVLLKMIKKTFIEPHLGSAVSTYYCKVCMLWMREKTQPELWRSENLLYCLTLCIRQLLEWVTMGYCPDYFVPENNIYDTKLFGATRFKLLLILKFLLSQDCRFLLAIECCGIGHLLGNCCLQKENEWLRLEELMIDYEIVIGAACECRTHMMRKPVMYWISSVPMLCHALTHAHCSLRVPLRYMLMIVCENVGFHIVSLCKANEKNYSQKDIFSLVHLASKLFSASFSSNAISVGLKLCAMVIENYGQTEICLQHISDHCMNYIYSCTGFEVMDPRVLKYSSMPFIENTEVLTSLELLQSQSSFVVVYQPLEIYIAPVPLRMEMIFRSLITSSVVNHVWPDCAMVDSLLFLRLLTFLNFSKQGNVPYKQDALCDMIHVIRTKPDIPHRDTALNLLGYCFLMENEPKRAFLCFVQSWMIMPYHNAAKFYLGLLFRKIMI